MDEEIRREVARVMLSALRGTGYFAAPDSF